MSDSLVPRAARLAAALAFLFTVPAQAQEPEAEGSSEQAAQEDDAKPKRARLRPADGTLPVEWAESLRYRSIGPANMGGRITDFAVHPERSTTYWVATAGGGVLKTTNNGVTYEHQFQFEGTGAIGAIDVARTNGDVVWVGTGEANPRNSVSWGDGVYRSTDGGETWTHMGLDATFQISSVVIHPEDENTVYIGALGRLWGPNEERGLFKTTDGGETWEKVLYVDDKTGVIDVKLHPSDPQTLIAATYERERDLYCSNDPAKKWGPGSGLHRSTDGGATWEELTEGLPTVTLGRIGIDWSASTPDTIFAVVETELITQEREDVGYAGWRGENAEVGARLTEVVEDGPAAAAELKEGDIVLRFGETTVTSYLELQRLMREKSRDETVALEIIREGEAMTVDLTLGTPPEVDEDRRFDELGYPRTGPFSGGLGGQRENAQDQQGPNGFNHGGIFRSDDKGSTWTRINSVNPRPMYYSELRVDPSDPNYIYVLGTSLYRSSDGGETFTSDGARGGVHVDHHALWVDPADGEHILLGNDGGIYVTYDRMSNWDHHNHVAIGQFYDIGIDSTADYAVYGGLQDNGTWGGPSRVRNGSGPINADWIRVGGGDGFVCVVDPTDPDLVYYESQNGGMARRHLETGESGRMRPSAPRGQRYRFNWQTPFQLSHHNAKIYYCAGDHVFRSLDKGNQLKRLSPKVTTTERGSATAFAESPEDADYLFVGTDDGGLWASHDGGASWMDLWRVGLPPLPEEEPEAEAAPADIAAADPITGSWSGKAVGAGIEAPDQGSFTVELALGESGAVTGTLESDIGGGAIRDGRFDAEARKLRFSFQGESMRLDLSGTLAEDGALSGDVAIAGAPFQFDFTAKRTQPAAQVVSTQDPEPEAEAAESAADDVDRPKNTIDTLMPGRRYVSELVASTHRAKTVYVTFDGHRSDDDMPYVFRSEDAGETWKSLRNNLPDHAGSVRCLVEDPENADALYLGAEHGLYASIDGGESWTRINGKSLPTVSIHDLELHDGRDELVVGTHGRAIWVLELAALRAMTAESVEMGAHLYPPAAAIQWRTKPSRATTLREFQGSNPSSGAPIYYSLGKRARDVSLTVQRLDGTVVRTLEASGDRGLHRAVWDLRLATPGGEQTGRSRFRRGRRATTGTYRVVLEAGGETYTQDLEVKIDPDYTDPAWITNEEEAERLDELFPEGDDEEGGDQESDD